MHVTGVTQDTMEDTLYKQNLSEWIHDEKKLVTYHYLSVTLGVHVNLAKQMLYEFYKEELAKNGSRTLEAIFYVSGTQQTQANDNDPKDTPVIYTSVLCSADKLDDLKNKLLKIYSVHLYSIKHAKSKNTLEEAVSETLQLSNDGQSGPEYGPFKIIKPQNPNQRSKDGINRTMKNEKSDSSARENKAPKSEPMEQLQNKSAKKEGEKRLSAEKPLDKKPDKDNKMIETKNASIKEVNKDSKDRLKNMFAAAAAKPREIKSEKSPIPEAKDVSRSTDISRKRQLNSTSRSSNSKRKNNSKPKPEVTQRRRIKVFTSSDESDSDSRSGNDKSDAESDPESPIPKRRQIQSGSESENEDIQESPLPREKPKAIEKPSLPPCKPGRRRVTKTVTKRVVDEDGYTVVKKEQVVVSESESDTEEKKVNNSKNDSWNARMVETKAVLNSKPKDNNRTKTAEEAAAAPISKRSNNSKQNANGKPKQASITSFFQKKP